MGFQIMAAPDVVHRRLAHPQVLGQAAAAPVGLALGFGLQGGVDDGLDLLRIISMVCHARVLYSTATSTRTVSASSISCCSGFKRKVKLVKAELQ
jgi:hypothetical protein